MARLNDTSAISGKGLSNYSSHSVSYERTDDKKFVVCESSCNPQTGEYKSRKFVMGTEPRIIPGRVARGPAPDQGNPLTECMRYLNDKG